MTCEELKTKIINRTLTKDDLPLIFVYPEDRFLVEQYLHEIESVLDLQITYVDNISDVAYSLNSLFDILGIYVFNTDKFTGFAEFSNYKNTIVLCKEVTNAKDYKEYIVEFSKLTADNKREYIETLCPGLSSESVDWLYDTVKGNIWNIFNECNKLTMFLNIQQQGIFEQLKLDDGYAQYVDSNLFELLNAITKKDFNTIKKYVLNIDALNISTMSFVTLLSQNIKYILDIQTSKEATAKTLGISEGQFKAIKYNCGKFENNKLIDTLEFLTEIDYRLKYGLLDFDQDSTRLIYILNNVVGVLYNG